MNHPDLLSEDPQLTAYALGQLDEAERAAVEAALRRNPTLRTEVEEIRAATALLEAALAAEPMAELPDRGQPSVPASLAAEGRSPTHASERAAGFAGSASSSATWGGRAQRRRGMLFRFPQFYYVAGGLAAACLAVVVALQRDEYDTREQAQATLARIARARQTVAGPGGQASALVAFSLPPLAPDSSGPADPNTRLRPSALAGFRGPPVGGAAGAAPAFRESQFVRASANPLSHVPVAVDAAGYAQLRRTIRQGSRPSAEAVRIEEMLNAFPFRYPVPKGDALFAAALEVAAAPWRPAHRLVRIGLKGREAEETRSAGAGGSAPTLAKDVRIQIEFNPAKVVRYRLIGYDPRPAQAADARSDVGDADDVGAGHTVTALYEIALVGAEAVGEDVAAAGLPFKYQAPVEGAGRLRVALTEATRAVGSRELLTVTVWYRMPDESGGRWLEFPLEDTGGAFEAASPDFRFAAAVAQYGMILCGSPHRGSGTLGDVLAWAAAALPDPADDTGGMRFDFLDLVRRTQALTE